MAKLGCHGTPLLRYSLALPVYPDGDIVERKVTVDIRSDGTVLKRFTVRWRDGTRHAYPWKNLGRGPGWSAAATAAQKWLSLYGNSRVTVEFVADAVRKAAVPIVEAEPPDAY